jgi:hypothetical protein
MDDQLTFDLAELVPVECFDEAAAVIQAEQGDGGGGRMKRALSVMAGSKLYAAMAGKFREIDLLPVFAKGWGESPELKAEADKAGDTAQPKFLRLGKFEQIVELYPILTVSAFGLSSAPIKLALTLEAEFDAVEVGLTKGHIVEAGGGVCQMSALLRFGQFSFPAGLGPVEKKLGNSRRFSEPGIKITGTPEAA